MAFNPKRQWILWFAFVVVVLVGAITDELSSVKLVTLQLRPGESVAVSVFRPIPHTLSLTSEFRRNNWADKRLELGDAQSMGSQWRQADIQEFRNPGVPILLLAQHEENEVIYEALPAGSYSAKSKWRDFVPFVDDGNPNRVPWPPRNSLKLLLPAGYSTIKISVLEVGAALVGEQVVLIVEPPISFKSHAPGYGPLWWFIFWPLYASLLTVYAAILVWMSWRLKVHTTKAA